LVPGGKRDRRGKIEAATERRVVLEHTPALSGGRANRHIEAVVWAGEGVTMEESNRQTEYLLKVGGGLFAAFVAPIVTGIILYYIQKKLDDPKPETPAPAAKGSDSGVTAKASPSKVAEPKNDLSANPNTKENPKLAAAGDLAQALKSTVRRPAFKKKAHAVERLFNGKDLAGFDTYLSAPHGGGSAYGMNNDPEHVFTVQGGELHISGKVFGGLVTRGAYENYHLTIEYKLGEKRWPPRVNLPRSSGIVLHALGAPGDVAGWSIAGISCHIGELETGSLSVPNGMRTPISFSAAAEKVALKKANRFQYVYKPGGPVTTLESGSVHGLDFHPAMAKNPSPGKTSRLRVNPSGEWNNLECICAGDRITVVLNGTVVNVATRVSQTRGKIYFESRGAEISFRTIELKPQP
jgi:hypothetical protein